MLILIMKKFNSNFLNFPTGVVKVTPAHDHNDYEIGKRHNLPFITIIDESGLIKDVNDFKNEYKEFIVSFVLNC